MTRYLNVVADPLLVKNSSGGVVAAGDVGYIDEAGEYVETTTEHADVAWCVVVLGGADTANIYVANRGKVTVTLDQNCSAGDYLYTSTTAGQATSETYVRPEVFAVALTANAAGAGGTCSALLLCQDKTVGSASTQKLYFASSLSDSDFVATINGAPVGAAVVYNAPSSGDEANLVPGATTYWAKAVLHNTTRGDSALISDCNTGTNTITLTAAAPGTWQNGDTITLRSQTNTSNPSGGAYFVDFEITAGLVALARRIDFHVGISDSGGAGAVIYIHPYTASVVTLRRQLFSLVASQPIYFGGAGLDVIDNTICIAWDATGANTLAIDWYLNAAEVATP